MRFNPSSTSPTMMVAWLTKDDDLAETLRKIVLADVGLRRAPSMDITADVGSSLGVYDGLRRPEVVLKFRQDGARKPAIRGRLVRTLENQYIIQDRRGQHWTADKTKWAIVAVDESDSGITP